MELTAKQTGFILLDIKKRGVQLMPLQEDLCDHICCLVEKEMEQTEDFKKPI